MLYTHTQDIAFYNGVCDGLVQSSGSLNVLPAHGHGLLVVHLLEVVEEAAPDLLDALVDAILSEMASVEVSNFPSHVLWVLELLHGVEANGVDEPGRGLEAARVLVVYGVVHAGEAPDGVVNVAKHLATTPVVLVVAVVCVWVGWARNVVRIPCKSIN